MRIFTDNERISISNQTVNWKLTAWYFSERGHPLLEKREWFISSSLIGQCVVANGLVLNAVTTLCVLIIVTWQTNKQTNKKHRAIAEK